MCTTHVIYSIDYYYKAIYHQLIFDKFVYCTNYQSILIFDHDHNIWTNLMWKTPWSLSLKDCGFLYSIAVAWVLLSALVTSVGVMVYVCQWISKPLFSNRKFVKLKSLSGGYFAMWLMSTFLKLSETSKKKSSCVCSLKRRCDLTCVCFLKQKKKLEC